MDRQELVERFFRHVSGTLDGDYDAIEELDAMARSNPREAWVIIRELIDRAPSDDVLAYIAAGPLEILLSANSEAVASSIRSDAERDSRVRAALGHVILSEVSDVVRKELSPWIEPI